jgi:acetyl/propionyl-CoA carboxylase alpha subunit
MKRFVSLAADGSERALGWRGGCEEGRLQTPEGEHSIEARFVPGGCLLRIGESLLRVEQAGAGRLRIAGREITVHLRSELEHRFAGFGAADAEEAETRLTVPMPGRVVKLLVQPGDEVRAGQGLVIVEAMKMENELKAPRAGRIAAVHVSEGAGVEKGTLLLELE